VSSEDTHDERGTDELRSAADALGEARARLASVPAEVVVVNHVMGLYELAAIHLSSQPPALDQARLAIDSVAALVDGVGERLGDDLPTLREALATLRMAFVQVSTS
jgi:hypothetical protein